MKSRRSLQNSESSWSGALFGAIFLAAGLFAGYFIAGHTLLGYATSSNWIEVPATIYHIDLDSQPGDSTTYSVSGSYTYEFNGQQYRGNRISLDIGNDNIGRYWQNLATSLRADAAGNEATAFVNPDTPQESVLDRTIRWEKILFGLVFLVLFGGVGCFFIWASLSPAKEAGYSLQPNS